MQRFEALLHSVIGLDSASVGSRAIERAVQTRMRACALSQVEDYWQRVALPGAERQHLVEAVVVPETWFFRDPQAFVALATLLRQRLSRAPQTLLRVLSIPCSTGEEPYSIAMALLDAGVEPARFRVEAIDISEAALEQARLARYGRNAFRSADLGFRARHFVATPEGCQLHERVRAQVTFRPGNLLDPSLCADAPHPAAIFCRNLLIYFDRTTQTRALMALKLLLDAEGLLFVAPSEAGLVLQCGFESLRIPHACGFRRASAVATPVERRTSQAMHASTNAAQAPPASSTEPARNLHAEARALAGAGRLAEAAALCEQQLREQGPNADTLHLLGLLRDTAGKTKEAAALYRKALYLDPQHSEALVHLAYLLEKQGDRAGALRLRARERRATRQDTSS